MMTPKQIPFGDIEVGREFKMSHQGSTYIKLRPEGRGFAIRNAQVKDNPNKKLYVQSITGVIVNE